MSIILEIAAGYLLGRIVVHVGSLLAQVIFRRIVLHSPRWQALIRRDDQMDRDLQRAVGR